MCIWMTSQTAIVCNENVFQYLFVSQFKIKMEPMTREDIDLLSEYIVLWSSLGAEIGESLKRFVSTQSSNQTMNRQSNASILGKCFGYAKSQSFFK